MERYEFHLAAATHGHGTRAQAQGQAAPRRYHHPHTRAGSFQLPRQEMSRDVGSEDVAMRGYDSPSEFTHSMPPPTGSLVDILQSWRSREVRSTVGSETELVGGGSDESDSPRPTRERSASTGDLASDASTKRSRYLREDDRRRIIQRIDSGEKQAELAREFGVTRAAICHINKNRAEILGRSTRADVHAAARHPKRRMSKAAILNRRQLQQQQLSPLPARVAADKAPGGVHVVGSHALAMHLSTLRRRETASREFRSVADRAFWLLLEEALASAPTHASWSGTEASCAMVMGECGFPLLEAFRRIQPDSPTGFMTFTPEHVGCYGGVPTLRKMCAPVELRRHRVFLLDATCATAQTAAVAIQSMLEFGAREESICLITLVISEAAVVELNRRFPRVHVAAAAMDPEVAHDGELRPGVGNFQERYFNTTTIHQSHLGSNVEL